MDKTIEYITADQKEQVLTRLIPDEPIGRKDRSKKNKICETGEYHKYTLKGSKYLRVRS